MTLSGELRHALLLAQRPETTAAGWGEGRAAAPQSDWQPRRIGANPPPVLPTLRGDAYDAVLAACEVPPYLARVSTAQGQRVALRRYLTTDSNLSATWTPPKSPTSWPRRVSSTSPAPTPTASPDTPPPSRSWSKAAWT